MEKGRHYSVNIRIYTNQRLPRLRLITTNLGAYTEWTKVLEKLKSTVENKFILTVSLN